MVQNKVEDCARRTSSATRRKGVCEERPVRPSATGVGPIPWTGQRLSGSDIAAELFLGVAACVMSLDPVSAL